MKLPIETERLLIREILPSDEEGMFEMDSDREVHKYLGGHFFTDSAQSRDLIAFIRRQYNEAGVCRWAIVKKDDGRFVGWTGFRLIKETINYHTGYYDFGYRLARKYWGQGYATEAAKVALQHGLEELKLKEVYAMTHPDNIASRNILEKIGLKFVGIFPYDCPSLPWVAVGEPTTWFEMPTAG